ncbi:MAG: DUF1648 domain-containing protein [candidate division WOR-3 bacterium]|nr:DUF1648 domain-containing protein [candidate division WOR-3 bacterium]
MRKSEIIGFLIVCASLLTGVIFYPQLPDRIPFHWNQYGEVNQYTSKFWGVFLMPIILLGCFILLVIVPRIDPLKENIKQFIKYYDGFLIIFLIVLLFIQLWMLSWNLGQRIDPTPISALCLGGLFYYLGILTEHARRNWFVGIRTPWTLSSEIVWHKTHKIGGVLFRICGILSVLGGFLGNYGIYLIIGPVILSGIFLTIYSYILYQKLPK